jgi:thiol-disulfide isomerase/thioredoxin
VAQLLYQYYEAGTIPKAEYLHRLNEVAFRLSGSGEELITGVPDDYRQRISPYQLFYPKRIRAEVTRLYQGKEMLRVTNGSMMDYRLILDQITEERDGLDSLTRNRVYRYALEQIIQHFSMADQERYLAAYREKYDDPAYLEYVSAAYQLNYDTATDDLALESLSGKQISLHEWLALQEGLIYVDFWASWCAPCRESFPKAAEMRTILADQPVTFLYISLDESRDKWREAVREEVLPPENNFRVLHPRTSPWLEKNVVQVIPRYMLLTDQGEMIQSRALGPGKDAQAAIQELLTDSGKL